MKLVQRFIVVVITLTAFLTVFVLYIRNNKNDWKRDITANEQHSDVNLHSSQVHDIAINNVGNNIQSTIQFKFNVKRFIANESKRLQIDLRPAGETLKQLPWEIAASWVNTRQIYPRNHPELSSILYAMSMGNIIHADVLKRGTQLKLLLTLEGGQKVVFKQKRYERDYLVIGKPYDGFDRHNAEIASFHLDRLLDFRRSPLVVGRVINLRTEIMPVASDVLLNTFLEEDGNICYYGVCYYCKVSEKACADGDMMEGSLTLWLPEEWSSFEKLRHPYQRTYVESRKAQWESDENYCNKVVKYKPPYNKGPRLLDITDGSVFDYLIGNADRHHYEVFKNKGPEAMLLMLDNAKSFGNYNVHEPSILEPIRQCCIIRNSTFYHLKQLQNGVLTELLDLAMESDPISPILVQGHLDAMNLRLPTILQAIETCIMKYGQDKVLLNEWSGL